jgi:hypothetical protein
MKKTVCFIAVAFLIFFMVQAVYAQGVPVTIQNEEKRSIEIKGLGQDGNFPTNPEIAGQSPVTGMPWTGKYLPMLVQIDNTSGGVGTLSQWGVDQADIIYETPLYQGGYTELTFLFSDVIPQSAGPIRSARITQAELREEWDGGFVFYGAQENEGTSVNALFQQTGANQKGVLFSGIVGTNKPWKKYYTRVGNLRSPHNVDADVKAMQALIPADFQAPARPYLFTDELPKNGERATNITIKQKNDDYASSFTYYSGKNVYLRSVDGEKYVDRYTLKQPFFANLIVQRTKLTFYGNDRARPVTVDIGSGNADIFMGGRYMKGFWMRTGMNQRTVFFDQDGNELKLQRGKTFISIVDDSVPVSYTGD